MVIYRFPHGSSGSPENLGNNESKHSEAKSPDFIYVGDKHVEDEETLQGQDSLLFDDLKGVKYPFFMRMITLLIACALTAWIVVLSFLVLVAAAMNMALLFRFPDTMQGLIRLWKLTCGSCAYALGFYVATFSPKLGFGILALYTLQQGKKWEGSPFSRMYRKSL